MAAPPAAQPTVTPPASEPTVAAIADAAVEVDAATAAMAAAPRLEPAMMAVGYGAPPSEYAREGAVRGRALVREVDSESVGVPTSERAVSSVLRMRAPVLRNCYERELRSNPTLAGVLSIRFVIDAAGRVSELRASGLDQSEAVRSCVGAIVRRMVFPVPARPPETLTANVRFEPES